MLTVPRELGLPVVYRVGYPFSTKDQDNDSYGGNSAVQCKTAWWYKHCLSWMVSTSRTIHGLLRFLWCHWKPNYFSVKRAELKIRRVELFYICLSLPLMTKYQVLEKIKWFKGWNLRFVSETKSNFFAFLTLVPSTAVKLKKSYRLENCKQL